jgi:DNA adenine methylase
MKSAARWWNNGLHLSRQTILVSLTTALHAAHSIGEFSTKNDSRFIGKGNCVSTTKIRPPLAGWIGGKSQLAKRIIAAMPEHECYVEVFAGAAWTLFKKPESTVEVINDISRDVTNLYRVIQHHLDEFVKQFRWQLISRDEWKRLNSVPPESLTDIQRAAQFYYVQRLSFSGKVKGRTYGTATTHKPRLNLLRLEEDLSAAHLRLSQVWVENLGFADCIQRYDREHTFFYLDPPYHGVENYYGDGIFSRDDFQRLADQLAGIKGKFLMSINDTPEIRESFKGFTIDTVSVTYSCGASSRPRVSELLIRNY